MKIGAVGRNNLINVQNRTNFKGLWGDTKKINEVSSNELSTDIYNFETKEYFPFADEHIESFRGILKDSTYTVEQIKNKENWKIHTGLNISIKSFLLFSKKQWLDYISYKISKESIDFKFIEKNLKNMHLERYLRA